MSDTVNSPLNPFNVNDDVISRNIMSIHDADDDEAGKQDVGSLFKVVSNIVSSISTNFTHSHDLKQVTVNLVEDEIPESAFRPTSRQLKEIAYQMTRHSFNESNAHESVVGVLEKLKSYKWDAKVVIALSAFALDFGETWRLSLMQGSNNKENAVELHVFRLAEEEKKPAQSDSTLINDTLKLIEKIIALEKLFANKSCKALSKDARDVYTYWAVFSLFACANQMEPGMKNKLVGRITSALTAITDDLIKIDLEIKRFQDYSISPIDVSSEILQLLKAIIFPNDFGPFESIASNTSEELVKMEELKTKSLFLFISGLDIVKQHGITSGVINSLESIYNATANHRDKKDYMILWAPAVKRWGPVAEKKFKRLLNNKSSLPRYVVQYLSLLKGLVKECNYPKDMTIMVGITYAFGKVITGPQLDVIMRFMQKSQSSDSIINHLNTPKLVNSRDITPPSSFSEIINGNPTVKIPINFLF